MEVEKGHVKIFDYQATNCSKIQNHVFGLRSKTTEMEQRTKVDFWT